METEKLKNGEMKGFKETREYHLEVCDEHTRNCPIKLEEAKSRLGYLTFFLYCFKGFFSIGNTTSRHTYESKRRNK